MRQILCTSSGVKIARMPRPIAEKGQVLIKVHYSMVSPGTELAGITPPASILSGLDKAKAYSGVAGRYLRYAVANPATTVVRLGQIVRERLRSAMPEPPLEPVICGPEVFKWIRGSAHSFEESAGRLVFETDESKWGYQLLAEPIPCREGLMPVFTIKGRVERGRIAIGLLNEDQTRWLGNREYVEGALDTKIVFDAGESATVQLVFANAGTEKSSRVCIDSVELMFSPPMHEGLPISEMEDQGWNLGYSAAGEVVAVGEGVGDLSVGDLVACGGAGMANHADYVSVPRNMVVRVPQGCSLKEGAAATIGSIAMQGLRRTDPHLGERVGVIGLGLLGQILVQLLKANGCSVCGLDLDPARIERAKALGLDQGVCDAEEFKKLARDFSSGQGLDQVVVAAATKSDAVINLAMEVARRRARVVILGDVGLNLQRAQFYRKEIDLVMSTSYGPGRYDREYEIEGRDYPLAYVRWTMNRNMSSFLELVAAKRIDVLALVDIEVEVGDAPAAYAEMAASKQAAPLGMVIHYPQEEGSSALIPDATAITLRGHSSCSGTPQRFALVGAGAFGTCMLAPLMKKCADSYFLQAVVSRDTTRGGNFARVNQVPMLATDLNEILGDPRVDMLVIATRHDAHAAQAIAGLRAGKNVFVEKPLAITWEELDAVEQTLRGLESSAQLMVGFNRRFSPALQELGRVLVDRRTPLIVNYRLNGGYIPPDHWVQTGEGGGRNIGEACHMYDVFRFLAGAPVARVEATSIQPRELPYLRTDNFCATLRYQDGSVGNLVYTALGPKQGLPKERIEVFCDGEAYLVDDFLTLTRCSTGEVLWQAEERDKGHFELLKRFGECLVCGAPTPLSVEEILETTAVALQVEDLLLERGHGG